MSFRYDERPDKFVNWNSKDWDAAIAILTQDPSGSYHPKFSHFTDEQWKQLDGIDVVKTPVGKQKVGDVYNSSKNDFRRIRFNELANWYKERSKNATTSRPLSTANYYSTNSISTVPNSLPLARRFNSLISPAGNSKVDGPLMLQQASSIGPSIPTNRQSSKLPAQATRAGENRGTAGFTQSLKTAKASTSASWAEAAAFIPTSSTKTISSQNMHANSGGLCTNNSIKTTTTIAPSPKLGGKDFVTNHFRIQIPQGVKLYRYDCDQEIIRRNPDGQIAIAEKKLSRRVRRRIFVLLTELIQWKFDANVATDYSSRLISTRRFGFNAEWTETIVYYDEDQCPTDLDLPRYSIKVKPARNLGLAEAESYLEHGRDVATSGYTDEDAAKSAVSDVVDGLNLVFSHVASQATVRYARHGNYPSETPGREPGMANIGLSKFFPFTARPLPLVRAPESVSPFRDGNIGPWYLKENVEPDGMLALLGFFRSVRAIDGGFSLNINAITGCFYQWINLSALMHKMQNQGASTPRQLENLIKGLRVQTTHHTRLPYWRTLATQQDRDHRERIYTVSGLPYTDNASLHGTYPWSGGNSIAGWPYSDNVTFQGKRKDGTLAAPVSIRTWWKDKGYPFQDNEYIIRIGEGKRAIFLPAGTLEVLPGQAYKNTIDMVEQACRLPAKNFEYIQGQALRAFGIGSHNDTAHQFDGISIYPNPQHVPAQRIDLPTLQYDPYPFLLRNARWTLQDVQFVRRPESAIKFARLDITYDQRPSIYNDIWGHFQTTFCEQGERLLGNRPKLHQSHGISHEAVNIAGMSDSKIEDAIRDAMQILAKERQLLLLVFLPDKNPNTYARVKTIADRECNLKNIRIQASNKALRIEKPRLQLVGNLMLKVNLKMGQYTANHTLSAIENNRAPALLSSSTMLVGIDVTHPGPGAMKHAPSIVAMVANRDKYLAQWPASLRLNPRPDPASGKSREEVGKIGEILIERLEGWSNCNDGKYPTNIVVYRDGLSEGQFDMCREREIRNMKTELNDYFQRVGRPYPKLTVICTVKRHHCRFYQPQPRSNQQNDKTYDVNKVADSNGNPRPGTIIDSGVTYGDNEDFFLASHTTIKGTSRPTHYVILCNDNSWSIQSIATSTYHLCYLWGRSTCSVGLAPPSYYADKACDRARCYAHKLYNYKGSSHDEYKHTSEEHRALANIPSVMDDMEYI